MEKTLVILKPCSVSRNLIGEIIHRFELKGLQICGMKMMQLNDEILDEHYAHLIERPYFQNIKDSMQKTPVIVCCLKAVDVVKIVHRMAGATNGREAVFGTIRGDYSVSIQENIIHTSDNIENAQLEINRFFKEDELFDFELSNLNILYANNEF